jgi:hypothetical protein
MFHKKKKGAYKVSAEMLSLLLFKKVVNIETIEFDKTREILRVFVSGEDCPEIIEGDEIPLLRLENLN